MKTPLAQVLLAGCLVGFGVAASAQTPTRASIRDNQQGASTPPRPVASRPAILIYGSEVNGSEVYNSSRPRDRPGHASLKSTPSTGGAGTCAEQKTLLHYLGAHQHFRLECVSFDPVLSRHALSPTQAPIRISLVKTSAETFSLSLDLPGFDLHDSKLVWTLSGPRWRESYLKIVHNVLPLANQTQLVDHAVDKLFDRFAKDEIFTNSEKKNYKRALIEIGIMLGMGGIWYFSDPANHGDQEYDLKTKFTSTQSIRFDDNNITLNVGHALAGNYYYQAARNNGLSRWESFLMALGASTVWEYTVEHKEVTSINDSIVTPIGGFIIGEALYQLAQASAAKPKSFTGSLIQSLVNPFGTIHQWIDKSKPRSTSHSRSDPDSHRITQRLENKMGVVQFRSKGSKTLAALWDSKSEIINIPHYNKPGTSSSFHVSSAFSSVNLRAAVSEEGIEDFRFATQVALAAYHKKSLEQGLSEPDGYNLMIAITEDFEFRSKKSNSYRNMIGRIGILGSTVDLLLRKEDFEIHLRLEVFGDFAMVRSLAYEKINVRNLQRSIPSEVEQQGYYYAFGVTGRAALEFRYKRLTLGASIHHGRHDNIRGMSRKQEELTEEAKFEDEILAITYRASLAVTQNWSLNFEYEDERREGSINSQKTDDRIESYMIYGAFRF